MTGRFKYQRMFYIFYKEDSGYEGNKIPSGHLRIEVKEGRGTLKAVINNLREDSALDYRLYAIKSGQGELKYADMGHVSIKRGKGDITVEFEPHAVFDTGHSIDKFNVFAILVKKKKRNFVDEIICPLVAYKDIRKGWRDELRKVLVLNSKEEQTRSYGQLDKKGHKNNIEEINMVEKIKESDKSSHKSSEDKIEKNDVDEGIRTIHQQNDNIYLEHEIHTNKTQLNSKRDESIDLFEGYMGRGDSEFPADKEKNEKYILDDNSKPRKASMVGLANVFNYYFEKSNPFYNSRKDYKWWNVDNPMVLNDLLFKTGIKIPLVLHQRVCTGHLKYKHLILGIYSDNIRGMQYLVLGVPSLYQLDLNPFSVAGRWVQVCKHKTENNSFGYWITYIDPLTGMALKMQ